LLQAGLVASLDWEIWHEFGDFVRMAENDILYDRDEGKMMILKLQAH
jgi:hypothetical protein